MALVCCPWIFPKTFHYSPLKILQTAVRPVSPGPAPPWRKSKPKSPSQRIPPSLFLKLLTLPTSNPHPCSSFNSTLWWGYMWRPSALHYGFHMVPHCAVSLSGLTPLLQTQVSTVNINITAALLTHHHYQCWRFRSFSAGEEKKEKRNVRESILPLFLWWLMLWVNLTKLWCSIIFSNTNLCGTMKVLFRLTFKSVDLA